MPSQGVTGPKESQRGQQSQQPTQSEEKDSQQPTQSEEKDSK